MDQSSKNALVAAVCRGFRAGLDADVRMVEGWVRGVVRGGAWRFHDPEAVAQEVLVNLLESTRAGRIQDEDRFQKFVTTVAKNICVDEYHRTRARRSRELDDPDAIDSMAGTQSPESDLIDKRKRDLLDHLFQRLPEHCRELWKLVYQEERPASDVARQLGLSAVNVRVRVHRCLERARAIYQDHTSWPGRANPE